MTASTDIRHELEFHRLCVALLLILSIASSAQAGTVRAIVYGGGDPWGGGPILTTTSPGGVDEGPHDASVSGFRNEASQAFASASGGFEVRDGKLVPAFHVAASYTGYEGTPFSGVSASVSMDAVIRIKPKTTLTALGIDISIIEFEMFDNGVLSVPQKVISWGGWHTSSYGRSFAALGGLPFQLISGQSSLAASLTDDLSGPQTVQYSNPDPLIRFKFVTEVFGAPAWSHLAENDELLLPIFFDASVAIDVIHFYASGGTASADFGNTSGISAIRIYDPEGNDITHLVTLTNEAGQTLFTTIPEPSSVILLVIASLSAARCRSRSRTRTQTVDRPTSQRVFA